MDPVTIGLLAGAGAGLLKGGVLDAEKERRQRKQEAEIARYSPWTGMGAQRVQEADPFGAALQGGTTGALVGQSMGPAPGTTASMDPEAMQMQQMQQQQQGYAPISSRDPRSAQQRYPWAYM